MRVFCLGQHLNEYMVIMYLILDIKLLILRRFASKLHSFDINHELKKYGFLISV